SGGQEGEGEEQGGGRGGPHPALATSSLAPPAPATGSPPKPPYSFSSLIFMALEDSPGKRLPVKAIYDWILSTFPYYRSAPSGWRNSVRHNLSLSKCFHRMGRDKSRGAGKGSLWCVHPEYRPALLESLRKTHCHTSPPLSEVIVPEAVIYDPDSVEYTESLTQSLLLSPSTPPTPAPAPTSHHSLPEDPSPWLGLCPLSADLGDEHNYSGLFRLAACLAGAGGVALQVEVGVSEELVAMDTMELELEEEKDPLTDSGYIEYHEFLLLPGGGPEEEGGEMGEVTVLQLDQEVQEAAGSLLHLAGGTVGGYTH
ncbi:forkhead box protein N3, partial [Amia ocellicauda]|uniref:forkhead box protein N3 n=1 Tax=Amia ocellicauda TaxID=2972642 RepID=UPI003464E065